MIFVVVVAFVGVAVLVVVEVGFVAIVVVISPVVVVFFG